MSGNGEVEVNHIVRQMCGSVEFCRTKLNCQRKQISLNANEKYFFIFPTIYPGAKTMNDHSILQFFDHA